MIRDFHMSIDQVENELTHLKGFALAAWNTEANPWVKVDRITPGYVDQEAALRKK